MALYKGYSSYEFEKTKNFGLYDVDLVRMDLLNHIYTQKGERVMMPNFGTRIPTMIFEPLDNITLEIIRLDLEGVFNFDPRVETQSLVITPHYDNNMISVVASLLYIELDVVIDFELNIKFAK